MIKYRNELKFICSESDLEILKERVGIIMDYDSHQQGDSYRIRSLYFDNYYNSAFYENAAGVDDRKKFRIRVYESTEDRINLEVKYKYRGRTHKESCLISKELGEEIIYDDTIPFNKDYEKPLMQFYLETKLHKLMPKIIIEYERTAFIYPEGNVRITFDRNIAFSEKIENFFDDRIDLAPILPTGKHVLEVKYDEYIPDFIAQLLELGNLERTTFSKFYLGRLCVGGENNYEYGID